MKKIKLQIKQLFLDKNYSEIIKLIDGFKDDSTKSSGMLNILGASRVLRNVKDDLSLARIDFKTAYLKEKKTLIALDALINMINVTVDIFDLNKSKEKTEIYLDELKNCINLFEEAKNYFGYNKKLFLSVSRVYKRIADVNKTIFFLKQIIDKGDLDISTICSYIYYNCFTNNWSQNDFFNNTKLIENNTTNYDDQNLTKILNLKKNKIKIAFLSSDIKSGHSITYFLKTVLKNYDKEKFEICLYLNNKIEDEVTIYFKKLVTDTFNIFKLNDLDAINLIRSHSIDIMFDLMGITSSNRINLFKNRLSPIQIAWLGYCNTTGLNNMDYLISDPNLIYESEKNLYHEKILFMPKIWNCHCGFSVEPTKNPPPYDNNKFITFGSLNNFNKINLEVLTIWRKILKNVKNSKLILKSSIKKDFTFIRDFFADENLADSIIFKEFMSTHMKHMDVYKDIDIALDTFPYNGVTTSFEATWMGVPVITMKGYNFHSRCGESINKNLGLNYLISNSQDDYFNKAVHLANNIEKLKITRNKIFEELTTTPLFDTKQFSEYFYNLMQETLNKSLNNQ